MKTRLLASSFSFLLFLHTFSLLLSSSHIPCITRMRQKSNTISELHHPLGGPELIFHLRREDESFGSKEHFLKRRLNLHCLLQHHYPITLSFQFPLLSSPLFHSPFALLSTLCFSLLPFPYYSSSVSPPTLFSPTFFSFLSFLGPCSPLFTSTCLCLVLVSDAPPSCRHVRLPKLSCQNNKLGDPGKN